MRDLQSQQLGVTDYRAEGIDDVVTNPGEVSQISELFRGFGQLVVRHGIPLPQGAEGMLEEPRMSRASTQSARSRTPPRSPNSVTRMRTLPPANSTSTVRGVSRTDIESEEKRLFAIHQDSEDHIAERTRAVVQPHERLETLIAR